MRRVDHCLKCQGVSRIEFDFQWLCLPAYLPNHDPTLLELSIVKAVCSQGSQQAQTHYAFPRGDQHGMASWAGIGIICLTQQCLTYVMCYGRMY